MYASLNPNDPGQRILLTEDNTKSDRGFNHPELGRLLLPVAYLEEYEEDSARYVVYIHRRLLTQPSVASLLMSTVENMP
jgi:hypothetical protein